MNSYTSKFICLFLAVVFSIGASTIAFAQNLPPEGWQGGAEGGWYVDVEEDDTLNVRSLPNHKSVKVGVVERGEEVNILDTSDNQWKFIEAGKVSGWVNGRYLTNTYIKPKAVSSPSTGPANDFEIKNGTISQPAEPLKPEVKTNSDDFETTFAQFKQFFKNRDSCYRSLKRRTELAALTIKLEQNDPLAFRNLKSKYDECVGSIDIENLEALENSLRSKAKTDTQKSRVVSFTQEYTAITEEALGILQVGQLMGISYE